MTLWPFLFCIRKRNFEEGTTTEHHGTFWAGWTWGPPPRQAASRIRGRPRRGHGAATATSVRISAKRLGGRGPCRGGREPPLGPSTTYCSNHLVLESSINMIKAGWQSGFQSWWCRRSFRAAWRLGRRRTRRPCWSRRFPPSQAC